MQEAIMMVKAELGREAVILHSKKIRKGGIFGLFGQPAFEVIAAINPEDIQRKQATASREVREVGPNRPVAAPPQKETAPMESLRLEVQGLKEALNTLTTSLNTVSPNGPQVPAQFHEISALLSAQGVADKYIEEFVEKLDPTLSPEQLLSAVQTLIIESIASYKPSISSQGPRIIGFVGPTGVGKTTTIAKLAARFALYDGLSVGLITADTYRIAAVDQLKTYAEIIGVPLEVVFTAQDITTAKAKLEGKDCILIDTAGRSPKNEQQINELQDYLITADPTDIALVLSATMSYQAVKDCLLRFGPCNYNQLIFTKLDEADSGFGTIYNAVRDVNLPLTYLTNGQNVPDDIVVSDSDCVTELLFGNWESI